VLKRPKRWTAFDIFWPLCIVIFSLVFLTIAVSSVCYFFDYYSNSYFLIGFCNCYFFVDFPNIVLAVM